MRSLLMFAGAVALSALPLPAQTATVVSFPHLGTAAPAVVRLPGYRRHKRDDRRQYWPAVLQLRRGRYRQRILFRPDVPLFVHPRDARNRDASD
jgi:hypothetical protein